METMRLRKIQAPSQVDPLLDALVGHSNLLPKGAARTGDLSVLSRQLRALATRATQHGQAWSCGERGLDTWLILCEMVLPLSRERGSPVLRIELYGDEGLKDAGLWTADRGGKWSRCGD